MKIRKALKRSKETGRPIRSNKTRMAAQTKKTLLFWLLKDKDSDIETKVRWLREILTADDWEIVSDE